jgi:uncharacterized damage-inducible protein DinB
MIQPPEVWLRGPVPGIQSTLQPVAHALLQVAEEIPPVLQSLTPDQLWARPGGSASIGFHAAHLAGSLGRLFTYARGEGLSAEQRRALAAERTIGALRPPATWLLDRLTTSLDTALDELRRVSPAALLEPRDVGRARLPSTTLGLLFHAAEHTARHAGQILTLARVVQGAGQDHGPATTGTPGP